MNYLKKIATYILLCLMVIGISECKKIETNHNPIAKKPVTDEGLMQRGFGELSDDSIILYYTKVGIMHNNAVDDVYDSLKILDSLDGPNQVLDFTQAALIGIVRESTYSGGVKPNNIDSLIQLIPIPLGEDVTENYTFESYLDHLHYELSGEFREALTDLESICGDDQLYGNTALYDSIIADRTPKISDYTEVRVFVATAATLKNSYLYWSSNAGKWDSLLLNIHGGLGGLSYSKVNDKIKKLIRADAMGAVAGGIRFGIAGAIYGTVVLPGVGTVFGGLAGAIVGGALSGATSSVASLIIQLIF